MALKSNHWCVQSTKQMIHDKGTYADAFETIVAKTVLWMTFIERIDRQIPIKKNGRKFVFHPL